MCEKKVEEEKRKEEVGVKEEQEKYKVQVG